MRWMRLRRNVARLTVLQKRVDSEDDHGHDPWQGCLGPLSRRAEEHCYCGPGAEEAGLLVSHVSSPAGLED